MTPSWYGKGHVLISIYLIAKHFNNMIGHMWVRISIRARCTTLCGKVYQWLAIGRWFSPVPLVSSTNKTDRHDITEILFKVALNTIKQTKKERKKQTTKYKTSYVVYYYLLLCNYMYINGVGSNPVEGRTKIWQL